MAKSTKALLMGRIQMCKTNPSIAHIGLATHGRSIQIGSNHLPAFEGRAELKLYRGGHMFYLDPGSRKAFTADARAVIACRAKHAIELPRPQPNRRH
jgi:hypothetical protein